MASTSDNSIDMSNVQIKPKPTLLTLPAELRDMIYATTLYHDENAGHIAPVHPDWKTSDSGREHNFRTLINGESRTISFFRQLDTSPYGQTDWNSRYEDFPELRYSDILTSNCEVNAYMKNIGEDEDKKVPFSGHVCSPACLVQPALTRVSRQLRDEALPVFYRCNKVYFDASTFFFSKDILRMPVNWWRGIGNSNLRALRRLEITDLIWLKDGSGDVGHFRFTYERVRGKGRVSVRIARGQEALNSASAALEGGLSESPELTECTRQLKEDGLFVRGIGKVCQTQEIFRIKQVDWPKEGEERPITVESWGGEHHAYVG